ncbi:MAG TPA: hypothetical protein VLZ82_01270 [Microbacterium sp.]|jgi:hypothetical protein|nr:hypothetical protein [Microbacterium sp.]
MTPGAVTLLLIAGLSESAGRILPLISRRASLTRSHVPKPIVFGLLLTGGVIDSVVFLVWPGWASALAFRFGAGPMPSPGVSWTAELAAPLILCAIICLPLIGPALHALVLLGVALSLMVVLTRETGISWITAAASVAIAGIGLALSVTVLRWSVSRLVAGTARARSVA